jgi:hypothetical protein
MASQRPNGRRNLIVLTALALVPLLLCSGIATSVGGTTFGLRILGIILGLYAVLLCVGLVTWLVLGRPGRG